MKRMRTYSKRKYPPKNTTPLEANEQTHLFQWAEYAACMYPELALLHHIPNGGRRSTIEAHRLRLQGVKAGVPDICLPVPRGGYGALYVELKRVKGGHLSENQRAWIDALNRAGNKAVVCRGFDEARAVIEAYLKEEEV